MKIGYTQMCVQLKTDFLAATPFKFMDYYDSKIYTERMQTGSICACSKSGLSVSMFTLVFVYFRFCHFKIRPLVLSHFVMSGPYEVYGIGCVHCCADIFWYYSNNITLWVKVDGAKCYQSEMRQKLSLFFFWMHFSK